MKLTTVIGIATLNEYAGCVPYFIRQWTTIFPEIQVRVVLVANAIPRFLQPYKPYIHLIPLSWIPEGITREDAARQLRFLYPAWGHTVFRQMGIQNPILLVSNIDTVPLVRTPFDRVGELYSSENILLQLLDTDNPETLTTFPVRYTMAASSVWRELYDTNPDQEWTWIDVANRMKPVQSLVYFRDILMGSSLYPSRIRVVGNGRIDYDAGVSDYVIPLPTMAYEATIEAALGKS